MATHLGHPRLVGRPVMRRQETNHVLRLLRLLRRPPRRPPLPPRPPLQPPLLQLLLQPLPRRRPRKPAGARRRAAVTSLIPAVRRPIMPLTTARSGRVEALQLQKSQLPQVQHQLQWFRKPPLLPSMFRRRLLQLNQKLLQLNQKLLQLNQKLLQPLFQIAMRNLSPRSLKQLRRLFPMINKKSQKKKSRQKQRPQKKF